MAKTISIGAQSFEFIRATLITRPRRFGKTLNLDMLNCFFSRKYKGRGELFAGLSIWGMGGIGSSREAAR